MRSVLVVEDNPLVYDTISGAFSMRGAFAVAHAANGYLALAALGSYPPDLALIDIRLPGELSGLEIAKRAVELSVPAVLMTGYSDHLLDAREHLFPVLTKPFRVIELVARFDDVVDEARRMNALMHTERLRGAELMTQGRRLKADISQRWIDICQKVLL